MVFVMSRLGAENPFDRHIQDHAETVHRGEARDLAGSQGEIPPLTAIGITCVAEGDAGGIRMASGWILTSAMW